MVQARVANGARPAKSGRVDPRGVGVGPDEVHLGHRLVVGALDPDRQVREDRRPAEVDVRDVEQVNVAVLLPDPVHDLGEELEGASGAVEDADRADPLVEDADELGVERIGGLDELAVRGRRLGPAAELLAGDAQLLVVGPIPARGLGRRHRVDRGEEATLEDLDDLGVLGGLDHRARSGDDTLGVLERLLELGLGLVEELGELLGLVPVGVGAGRERDDHDDLRVAGRKLEEALEERRDRLRLATDLRVARARQLAEVVGNLVDDEDRRLVTDDRLPCGLAGRRAALVRCLELRVGVRPKLSGELAPERMGPDPVGDEAVLRIESVSDNRGHSALRGDERRVDEVGEIRRTRAASKVVHGHQAMGLAATEGGREADDPVLGARNVRAADAAKGPGQELAQARRRVGDRKERVGVTVDRIAGRVADDLVELGREVVVGKPAAEHVRTRGTGLRDWSETGHATPSSQRLPPGAPCVRLSRNRGRWRLGRRITRVAAAVPARVSPMVPYVTARIQGH